MLFNNILYFETIDSTNLHLKENDYPPYTIIYTYNQTKGRGRENRKWLDFQQKNLALSILFKPEKFNNSVWYIATLSIALVDLLKEYNINNLWIKWPNDIYIEDKKLSGILAETIFQNNKIEKFIIGIGININLDQNDLLKINKKATSLFIETNNLINLNDFVIKFIQKIEYYFYIFLVKNDINFIKSNWLLYSKIIGKKVEWINNNNKIIATVKKIDDSGYLYIENEKKEELMVISGDINLI